MAGPALLRALRTLTAGSGRLSAPASCALSPVWRTSCVRTLQLSSASLAGHNKWSKVKHIKGPKDAEKARVFAKFGLMIRIAVKEGGPNPDLNVNLAQILEQCRSKNMTKASIDAAIKGGDKAKLASQHTFEVRGPGGCLLLVEVLTDNNARTQSEIKRILNKNGGTIADKLSQTFNKRGVVVVSGQDVTAERALELAIEAGAEDVKETEDEEEKPLLQFICSMTELHKVRTSLEELGMKIASAGLEFVPRTHMYLSDDQLEAASVLIEAINDFPEVVRVWDNIWADS